MGFLSNLSTLPNDRFLSVLVVTERLTRRSNAKFTNVKLNSDISVQDLTSLVFVVKVISINRIGDLSHNGNGIVVSMSVNFTNSPTITFDKITFRYNLDRLTSNLRSNLKPLIEVFGLVLKFLNVVVITFTLNREANLQPIRLRGNLSVEKGKDGFVVFILVSSISSMLTIKK